MMKTISRDYKDRIPGRTWIEDLFALFFPRICLACQEPLTPGEDMICTLCQFHLPRTNFHLDPVNPLARVFWGRVRLEAAAAFCFFQKGGTVQHLLHQLKYKGHQEVGLILGKMYGAEILRTSFIEAIDVIVPVPLHPLKLRKRGYNQSERFAKGLHDATGLELVTDSLFRKINSSTQTRKGRYSRWENVGEIFGVRNEGHILNCHILLVDDVVTTGATLEACAQVLLEIPGTRVSVAAIAYAV